MENAITKQDKHNLIQTSITSISTRFDLTPAQAWHNGTNVQMAFATDPKLVHVTLMALLKDAVDYLEMNKSFRNGNDYMEAVTYLIEYFPAMKLEEWKVITKRLKAGYYGKMYERLKLPELVEIFQQHEGERAEMIERQLEEIKNQKANEQYEPISEDQKKMWKEFIKGLNLPETTTDKRGRWKHIPYPNKPLKDD